MTGSAGQNVPRRFSRIHFATPATLDYAGAPASCALHDISLHGALVELTGAAPSVGTPCTLTVTLDGGAGAIRMKGKVVHAHGGRCGLQCEELDLESIQHLRRLVEVNLGDEAALHRELAALVGAHER